MKKLIKNIYLQLKNKCFISKSADVSLNSIVGIGSVVNQRSVISRCKIGNDCYIGNDSQLFDVKLGSYSSLGPRVTIGENEHFSDRLSTSNYLHTKDVDIEYRNYNSRETIIGADVWVGAGAFIKKGVTIGHGCIVGAHSVIVKDIPPYAIVVGVPGKVIRYRFKQQEVKDLLKLRWWDFDRSFLDKNKKILSSKDVDKLITSMPRL